MRGALWNPLAPHLSDATGTRHVGLDGPRGQPVHFHISRTLGRPRLAPTASSVTISKTGFQNPESHPPVTPK